MGTAFTFEQLMKAAMECSRNVKWKDSIASWTHPRNIALNCMKLLKELDAGTYHLGGYATFKVFEPKKRTIKSPKFRDRVVQRAMCDNGLYHDLTKGNIYDNGACQNGKGTLFMMNRLNCHLQRYWRKNGGAGWVIKADIRRFFDSINHDKLKEMVRRLISNDEYRLIVEDIIDSFDNPGIGLGSQISQLLAIAFLSPFDHYVKEQLRIKHYVRYSDDMIIIHPDKEYLLDVFEKMKKKLSELSLELNSKSKIFSLQEGIDFMKFKFFLDSNGKVIRILNKGSEIRIRRRIKKLNKKQNNGKISHKDVVNCFASWKAHADLGNSYHKIRRIEKLCLE